jgi:hypothetical protein
MATIPLDLPNDLQEFVAAKAKADGLAVRGPTLSHRWTLRGERGLRLNWR